MKSLKLSETASSMNLALRVVRWIISSSWKTKGRQNACRRTDDNNLKALVNVAASTLAQVRSTFAQGRIESFSLKIGAPNVKKGERDHLSDRVTAMKDQYFYLTVGRMHTLSDWKNL